MSRRDAAPAAKAGSRDAQATGTATDPAKSPLKGAGNLAVQRLLLQTTGGGGAAATDASPAPATPVRVWLDEMRPWTVMAKGNPDPGSVANEVYGADLPGLVKPTATPWWTSSAGESCFTIEPALLRAPWVGRFQQLMEQHLQRDVKRIEEILFELRIDSDDESTLMSLVSWWAGTRDLRTPTGRTWFDAFLGRLRSDRWYRDYGLWQSKSRPYLDLLYTEVEEKKGELLGLIARNSIEFGAYRPEWAAFEGRKFEVNTELVKKSAQLVLDGLEGYTSGDDSRIISDAIKDLPAPEQAAVLQEVMRHYDDTDWTGLFGKYGEAWQGGMLYFLFEDLSAGDRQKVAKSLIDNKVMSKEAVDALVAGRGIGKYLPYTTRKGQEATEYWADVAVKHDSTAAAIAGGFSALWMPETAGQTIAALSLGAAMGAGLPARLAAAFPKTATVLAVPLTFKFAFDTTLAVQAAATGKDAWTGNTLSWDERLSQALIAASNVLLFVAGGLQGRAANQPPAPQQGEVIYVATRPAYNAQTGEWVSTARLSTGDVITVRINSTTGNGVAYNLTRGTSVAIVNGRPVGAVRGLLPEATAGGTAGAGTPTTPGPAAPGPQALAPRPALGGAAGGTGPAVTGAALVPVGTRALDVMVWANPKSMIYHRLGSQHFRATKEGSLMTAARAESLGYRAATPPKGGSGSGTSALRQIASTAGRVAEKVWSVILQSPTNPGRAQGGEFVTPFKNVQPDFIPAVTSEGKQVFARNADYAARHGVPGIEDALLVADSKYYGFTRNVKTLSFATFGDAADQVKGMIWLAGKTQSRTFVILGKPDQVVGPDIRAFATALGVEVTVQSHPLIR